MSISDVLNKNSTEIMVNKKWFLLRGPSQQVDHVPVSGMNIIYLDILKKSCLFYLRQYPIEDFKL